MLFLRLTSRPEEDLERGFSGNVNAWFDDRDAAEAHAARHGAIVRQCPVSSKWCGDPEPGLSAFAFEPEEEAFLESRARLAVYVASDRDGIAVFESDEWDRGAGLDGEDCFRKGRTVAVFEWKELDWSAVRAALPERAASP